MVSVHGAGRQRQGMYVWTEKVRNLGYKDGRLRSVNNNWSCFITLTFIPSSNHSFPVLDTFVRS